MRKSHKAKFYVAAFATILPLFSYSAIIGTTSYLLQGDGDENTISTKEEKTTSKTIEIIKTPTETTTSTTSTTTEKTTITIAKNDTPSNDSLKLQDGITNEPDDNASLDQGKKEVLKTDKNEVLQKNLSQPIIAEKKINTRRSGNAKTKSKQNQVHSPTDGESEPPTPSQPSNEISLANIIAMTVAISAFVSAIMPLIVLYLRKIWGI